MGSILAEKRNPVKTYWFIFTGLAQQNIRSLTLITRVRDLLSGSSGIIKKAPKVYTVRSFFVLKAFPALRRAAQKAPSSFSHPSLRQARQEVRLRPFFRFPKGAYSRRTEQHPARP